MAVLRFVLSPSFRRLVALFCVNIESYRPQFHWIPSGTPGYLMPSGVQPLQTLFNELAIPDCPDKGHAYVGIDLIKQFIGAAAANRNVWTHLERTNQDSSWQQRQSFPQSTQSANANFTNGLTTFDLRGVVPGSFEQRLVERTDSRKSVPIS